MINDQVWNEDMFLPTVGKRGAAIIEARGLSSAASAANAAIDHMRDWALGTNGKWVTMGVPSNGEYGIPKDVMFGFPVTTEDGEYKIVEGLRDRRVQPGAHQQDAEGTARRAGRRQAPAVNARGALSAAAVHPRDVLFGAGEPRAAAAGVRPLQRRRGAHAQEPGSCRPRWGPVFDVTLDCEDGAPVGGEAEHARWSPSWRCPRANRTAASARACTRSTTRRSTTTSTRWSARAGARLAYLMVPKVRDLADVKRALRRDRSTPARPAAAALPLHVLIETHGALRDVVRDRGASARRSRCRSA